MIIRDQSGEKGWAALAEALRLRPSQHQPQPYDLDNLLNNEEFHLILVYIKNTDPRNLMVSGRRQDVKAVFAALMIGSLWLIVGLSDITNYKERRDKHSEEDWVRLKWYIET